MGLSTGAHLLEETMNLFAHVRQVVSFW